MTDKDAIFDDDPFAEKAVAGDFAVLANEDIFLDLDESSDSGVVSNCAAI